MTESFRISVALLAIASSAGFLAAWDRVCHALRVACAALIVTLAGVFYGSSIVVSGGAVSAVLSGLIALIRSGLYRQRPQSGVRHETLP